MDAKQIRDQVVEALQGRLDAEATIQPIGNSIHLFVEGTEFEMVIKTIEPERRLSHDTGPYLNT